MAINFKKILLAGTALVAVAGFSAQAQAADLTLSGAAVWGTAANGMVATPVAGDNVIMGANQLAFDGSELGVLTAGAITSTTGALLINTTDNAANVAFTIGSYTSTSTGNLTILNPDASTSRTLGAVFTGAVSVGGAMSVSNLETAAPTATTMTVGTTLDVVGLTTIIGGAAAGGGATVAVTSTGNATFTGAVTVTGGAAHAGNTATLTLNGATNTFSNGITVDTNTGVATLAFSGLTTAQSVSGTIAGDGLVTVANAAGATFSGTLTAAGVTIENGGAALNSAATFKHTVTAPITLGGAGTGTNTVTFDGTTQAFTVTGALEGAIAGETNNVVVSGGRTITTATAWGGGVPTGLDSVAVSGTGTILSAGASMTSAAFTVGTGATLQTSGAATLTGTINGAGTLDVNANTTVTGIIGGTTALTTVDIAAGTTLTLGAGLTYAATSTVLSGVGTGILSLNASAHALTTDVTTAVSGAGAFNVLDNASTSSITGNIGTSSAKLATMDIAGGAANVFTTTGNLYVNAITANAADTLQFIGTSAQTVSGTLTGGILIVGNAAAVAANTTFSGAVATLASGEVKAGATANFTAGLGAVGFTNAGTTNFTGTTASTLTGAITNTGTINNTGTGLITTTALTNSTSGGVVSLTGGSLTAGAGALTNQTGGTVTISSGKTLTAATQVAGTGTYNFGVSTTAATGLTPVGGKIVLTGGASDLTNATINVNVPSTSGFIATGTAFKVVDGTVAATTPVASGVGLNPQAVAADDSRILSFTYARGDNAAVTGGDSTEVYVIATRVAYSAIGTTTANDQGVGTALNTIANTGTTELDAIQSQLNAATTDAAVHTILESIAPTVDGSASVTSINVGSQVQGISETRMASLRSGDGLSGVAAGAAANGWNMWLQGYGQHANQDLHDGVQGYDSDTLGGAIGIDTTSVASNAVVGVSFNYGQTNADSDNANTTATDVDNYGFNVYGSYDLGQDYFANGQVGYAYNKINTDRHNATGPLPVVPVTARGETNSSQYMAKLGFGRDFNANSGLTLTPSVSAAYTHLSTDGYTETGAGGANLIVGSDSMHVLRLGVGVNAGWNLKNTDGSVMKPALRIGYSYEALDDRVDTTSSFQGDAAGTTFTTQGPSPDRSAINAGAGLTYMTTANFDLSANYDYTYKANYDAHTGVLRATSHF